MSFSADCRSLTVVIQSLLPKFLGLSVAAFALWALAVGGLYASQRSILYPAAGSRGDVWNAAPFGYQTVDFRTADGLTLRALYRKAEPGRRTIIFLHGNGDTVAGSARMMSQLTDAGYGALLVEFRGYAGNPGTPTEQGLYADGFAAVDWLRSQGVAADQTIVAGYSLGSGVASKLAANDKPAALVLIAPFTSVPAVAWGHFPWLPTERLMLDRYDTIDRIAAIKAPILLIHGLDDRTIPAENSRILARANPGASLVLVPDQTHVIAYDPVAGRTMLDWLRQKKL